MLRKSSLVLCLRLFVLFSLRVQSFEGVFVMRFPFYDCHIDFLLGYCVTYGLSQLSFNEWLDNLSARIRKGIFVILPRTVFIDDFRLVTHNANLVIC